jgi:hypothetical protein
MGMRRSDVHLHIDELIVEGLPISDRDALGASVRGELTRLLLTRDVPSALAQNSGIESLKTRTLRVTSPAADAVGMQIAQAVHESLGK